MVWIHPRDRKRERPRGPLFHDKHWQACYDAWYAHAEAQNTVAKTHIVYDLRVRCFFKNPDKTPDQYSKQDVERFLQARNEVTGEPNKPASYNGKRAALASFYDYASTYEYEFRGKLRPLMTRNPPTAKIKSIKTSTKSRALSDDELKRLFRAIKESDRSEKQKKRDRALFLVYLWSGRRCAEIARLRWRDIQIVQHWDEQARCTRDMWIYYWRGKGHRERDDCAEMPPVAVQALIEWLEADGRWGKMQPNDALFPGAWPPATMHPGSIGNILRYYCRLAGLNEAGVHRFRHTAAMARWEKTQSITYVQQFLRHKNISATMVYVYPDMGQADTVAAQLQGRFGDL